jgi:expansin (peptidoglycan-binding protein)
VTITNNKNGKTMTAVCADTCPGCAYGSLDMSSGLFAALGDGDFGQGVFPISWSFN